MVKDGNSEAQRETRRIDIVMKALKQSMTMDEG